MKLESYFPYRLAIAAEAFSQRLVEVYGGTYGLSREEWRLLLLLAKTNQMTSFELSQRTTLDKVQISRSSQRLESKGLITRKVSAQDKRLRVYACTKAGQDLFAEIFPIVDSQANTLLSALPPKDRVALFQGIEALTAALAKPDQYSK